MQSLTSSNRKLLISRQMSPDVASWPCRYLVVQDMTRSSCGHCTPQLCLKKQLLCRSSPSLGCSRVCQRASGGQAASRIKTNMSNLYRKLCQCEQDAPENTRQILAVAESTLSKGYSKHSWSFFVHKIHQNTRLPPSGDTEASATMINKFGFTVKIASPACWIKSYQHSDFKGPERSEGTWVAVACQSWEGTSALWHCGLFVLVIRMHNIIWDRISHPTSAL